MTHDHDPQLEALFAQAAMDTPNGDFADRVMADVDTRRRNVILIRVAIVAAIVLLEVLLSAPLQSSVGAFMEWLSSPILDLNESWVTTMLEPVNSIAGIIGVVLLAGHIVYRRFVR